MHFHGFTCCREYDKTLLCSLAFRRYCDTGNSSVIHRMQRDGNLSYTPPLLRLFFLTASATFILRIALDRYHRTFDVSRTTLLSLANKQLACHPIASWPPKEILPLRASTLLAHQQGLLYTCFQFCVRCTAVWNMRDRGRRP